MKNYVKLLLLLNTWTTLNFEVMYDDFHVVNMWMLIYTSTYLIFNWKFVTKLKYKFVKCYFIIYINPY